jgi:hypothetical protein
MKINFTEFEVRIWQRFEDDEAIWYEVIETKLSYDRDRAVNWAKNRVAELTDDEHDYDEKDIWFEINEIEARI